MNEIEKTCMVYQFRPMACRKYYVSNDPELCDLDNNKEDVSVFYDLHVESVYEALVEVCEYVGLSSGTMEEILLKRMERSNGKHIRPSKATKRALRKIKKK